MLDGFVWLRAVWALFGLAVIPLVLIMLHAKPAVTDFDDKVRSAIGTLCIARPMVYQSM